MCGDTVRAQEQSREEADGGAEQWDTLRPRSFSLDTATPALPTTYTLRLF